MQASIPAADRAYQHVKEQILSGEVSGGELLSEGTVATELGISRTPVHEAFLRLDVENLLVLFPRRGAAVVPMAPDEARDVLEMREAVETATARRALAGGAPPDDVLAAMRENVARQRELAAAGDVEGFADADGDFHAALIRASRNQTALQFHDLLRDRQRRLRFQLLSISAQHVLDSLGDHELMLSAVEKGDADEFCRLISTHVRRHRGVL
ncbi:MAG TPA: GntR family transcriptional regulator [Propionibacteriaceae bacterium]|nr:GntR family transcriptional regulator [Propionibacteriaceae bacterium]